MADQSNASFRAHKTLHAIPRNTLLDQIMIDPLYGTPNGRGPCAFVAVVQADTGDYGLGIAVANEAGYVAVPHTWARYPTWDLAVEDATRLNRSLDLADDTAARIIASSMGGAAFAA